MSLEHSRIAKSLSRRVFVPPAIPGLPRRIRVSGV
jgi:hypothetical protein